MMKKISKLTLTPVQADSDIDDTGPCYAGNCSKALYECKMRRPGID